MRFGLLSLLLVLGVLGAANAAAAPAPQQPVDPSSADGAPIVQAGVNDVTNQLGKPAKLAVTTLNVSGQWAFIHAKIEGADGGPIDYSGTPVAQRQFKSNKYAALLKGGGQQWSVVADAVAPTDVAWEGWDQKYGAPADIFSTS